MIPLCFYQWPIAIFFILTYLEISRRHKTHAVSLFKALNFRRKKTFYELKPNIVYDRSHIELVSFCFKRVSCTGSTVKCCWILTSKKWFTHRFNWTFFGYKQVFVYITSLCNIFTSKTFWRYIFFLLTLLLHMDTLQIFI